MAAGILTSQFSTEPGPSAAVLRYLTAGEVSHVDLVLPSGYLLGARLRGGVVARPPDYHKFSKIVRVSCMVPDVDAAYRFAYAQLGKPYNKQAIVDFFLHRERAFTLSQPRWFCDEMNYCIYLVGGVQLLNTTNPLMLTPQEELLSNCWTTRHTVKWS